MHRPSKLVAFSTFVHFILLMSVSSGSSEVISRTQKRDYNPLNGQHLRWLAMEFPGTMATIRNATGHVIYIDGFLKYLVETLSTMFNFSISYLPIDTQLMEDSRFARGAISYLIRNEADWLLSTRIGTANRFQYVDYPSFWHFESFGTIVPYPKVKYDTTALLKPFSYQAWILIVTSVFAIIICLRLFSYKSFERESETNSKDSTNKEYTIDGILRFVLGNLFSQGQHWSSTKLKVRIAAGVWCVGCFFLVQIYCSTLTSHLTAPNQKPIVNSFYEIANTPGVRLAIENGRGIESIIMQNTASVRMKPMQEMLRKYSNMRCNVTTDCVAKVKDGSNTYAYTQSVSVLKMIMEEDEKNTSTCNYYLLKEELWSSPVFTALPKHSPYTETISIGLLRTQQSGLSEKWRNMFVPKHPKCMNINQRTNEKKLPRLSIGHLSSAFVILIAGYVLSIAVFVFEKLHSLVVAERRRNAIRNTEIEERSEQDNENNKENNQIQEI